MNQDKRLILPVAKQTHDCLLQMIGFIKKEEFSGYVEPEAATRNINTLASADTVITYLIQSLEGLERLEKTRHD